MWADLSQGLDMHVEATAANPSDAAELRDAFKAAVSMGGPVCRTLSPRR